MKYLKRVLYSVIIMILFMNSIISAFAMEDNFATEELSKNTKETFLSNVDIFVITAEEKDKPISCFDVNSDGCIVLGFYDTDRKKVCVYNNEGVFKYGYSFKCSGTFGVGWSGENITIYFVRSDVAATFDESAECLQAKKIENTIDNNSYWNHMVFASKKNAGKKEYYLRNRMGVLNLFASSYSQLVEIDEEGKESVIYNVNDSYFMKLMIKVVLVIIMILVIILSIIWRYKKFRIKNSVK